MVKRFPIGLDNFDVKNPSALLSREPVKGSWMGEHLKDQNSIEHFAVCVKKEFDKILHDCGCANFDQGDKVFVFQSHHLVVVVVVFVVVMLVLCIKKQVL